MNMRTLLRSVARERMKRAGVGRMNEKRVWKDKHHLTRNGWIGGHISYFASAWRKYLDPTTQEYKWGTEGRANKRRWMRQKVRI